MKSKRKVMKCPYCGHTAVLRDASYVYGEKAIEEHLYVCSRYPECNAYVGVHKGTLIPKGTLANGDLRHKRIEAHKAFSKLWDEGIMSKKQAYHWLGYLRPVFRSGSHRPFFRIPVRRADPCLQKSPAKQPNCLLNGDLSGAR